MKYYYPNFEATSCETMQWKQGQPCSHCGKPTNVIHHQFSSGNKKWEYFAPLYHNASQNLGFCEPNCVLGWIDSIDSNKMVTKVIDTDNAIC